MDTDRGDGHVKGATGREWRGREPRAPGWPEPAEAGRDTEGPTPGDHGPAHAAVLTSGLQDCRRIRFCCFKLSGLWSFVMTAPGT